MTIQRSTAQVVLNKKFKRADSRGRVYQTIGPVETHYFDPDHLLLILPVDDVQKGRKIHVAGWRSGEPFTEKVEETMVEKANVALIQPREHLRVGKFIADLYPGVPISFWH